MTHRESRILTYVIGIAILKRKLLTPTFLLRFESNYAGVVPNSGGPMGPRGSGVYSGEQEATGKRASSDKSFPKEASWPPSSYCTQLGQERVLQLWPRGAEAPL